MLTLKVMYVNEQFISCGYISYNREKEKTGKITMQYLKTPAHCYNIICYYRCGTALLLLCHYSKLST